MESLADLRRIHSLWWRILSDTTSRYLLPSFHTPVTLPPRLGRIFFFRKSSKEYSQKKRFRIFQTETLEPLPVPSNPLPGFREFTQNKMLKLILFVTILFIKHRKCCFFFRLNKYGKENKERKRILEVRKQ